MAKLGRRGERAMPNRENVYICCSVHFCNISQLGINNFYCILMVVAVLLFTILVNLHLITPTTTRKEYIISAILLFM